MDYTFGGALVRSTVPLAGLTPVQHRAPAGAVITVTSGHAARDGVGVFWWPAPYEATLERARAGWVYRVPAAGLAIDINDIGDTIQLDYPSGAADAAGRTFARRVLPRVMDLHGRLLMHGATLAVAEPASGTGAAIALVGRSRAGKSTLAAALCRHGRFRLMGDDTAVLERDATGWLAHSSTYEHGLWPDSVAALADDAALPDAGADAVKLRRPAHGEPVRDPRRLRAIYVLDTADALRIEPLSKLEAMQHLIRNALRFYPADRQAEAVRLSRMHALLGGVPVARLSYPRRYERLDDVCLALARAHE